MAGHEAFLVTRRFSHVRTRLLLWEQDRVAELETKLNKIDNEEKHSLYLGSRRKDKNQERRAVIAELQEAIKSYDDLVTRSIFMLGPQPAYKRDIASLQNWHVANASVTRAEMDFLNRQEDLMSVSSSSNTDVLPLWVERDVTEKALSFFGVSAA
ncbi:uncharacterized protein QC761_0024400 [Podospora bellae-mahoneyi]|uniref:DUF6594 domain-containing protein n=1 Tax=Podospora bellae-mahoneyi TaxID=2093777 RepID=A0ABR0G256_9PEZI|nr:hypothetical protein QC761_0024400 [Podospora bellae-mahoneyi]